MRKAIQYLPVALFAAFSAIPADAAEYCVTCAAPAAMYRCVIADTPEGAGSNPREQLACITELAKLGNHETCTASKSAPIPCPGLTQILARPTEVAPQRQGQQQPAGEPAPAAGQISADQPTPDQPPADAAQGEATETSPDKKKVPRTVEELAGQTVQSTKEGLKKAGEAVGDTANKAGEKIGTAGEAVGSAAKKTWNCLTSFFSDC